MLLASALTVWLAVSVVLWFFWASKKEGEHEARTVAVPVRNWSFRTKELSEDMQESVNRTFTDEQALQRLVELGLEGDKRVFFIDEKPVGITCPECEALYMVMAGKPTDLLKYLLLFEMCESCWDELCSRLPEAANGPEAG